MKPVLQAGFSTLQTASKLLASVAAAILAVAGVAGAVRADDDTKPKTLLLLNYVTGWTHDAIGYHPAIFMLLENVSDRDISNKLIRFQARFTDLHTAEVSIGRAELRRELKPHQQFSMAIEGEQGFELPFELHQWPSIETKVMSRVGQGGDESTETLTIAKVDAVARTTNEAFEALNQATSYNPNRPGSRPLEQSVTTRHPAPPKQMRLAETEPLKASPARRPAPRAIATAPADAQGVVALFNSKALPGLGDDFYNFEQRFGLPQSTDAKRPDWTWAKYRHGASGTDIIAGARDRSGKVDVIVMKVQRGGGMDQIALVNAAKQMAGKLKSQPLSSPAKSVRYLPSGRVELITSTSTGYKVICMTPSEDSDNSFILVLTRVQQDTDVLLPSLATKSSLLGCLRFLDQQNQGSD